MSSLRDQVLSRYWEAAKVMAAYPVRQPQGSSSDAPTCEEASASAEMGARGVAMQVLLIRQARSLAMLHEAVVGGDGGGGGNGGASRRSHGDVDEELLRTRLDDVASVSMAAFYAYRFDLLPYYWRQLYTDTLILMSHYALLRAVKSRTIDGRTLDLMVENLDRALITAGGAGKLLGKPWIEKTMELLEAFWREHPGVEGERPVKRARTDTWGDATFSTEEPFGRPLLSPEHTCPHHESWTLERFENYMNEGEGGPSPIVFTDLIKDWPALTDHPWNSPGYLLSRTFGGRRLVPIEVGRSYVDRGWSQELVQFRAFLKRHVDPSMDIDIPLDAESSASTAASSQPQRTGYLAQHNLFQQIPPLRSDIQVPDFCWADVPGHPTDPSADRPAVGVPQLNAWFGPARTITPLHTDGYHNLLCQVVGAKYVRLYPPRATPRLRPRGVEHGVDMSNTSGLDVGVLEGWDPEREREEDDDDGGDGERGGESLSELRESLEGVQYWECILRPGDTLVIPIGWWHYVRSLSISFSVSFWWN